MGYSTTTTTITAATSRDDKAGKVSNEFVRSEGVTGSRTRTLRTCTALGP